VIAFDRIRAWAIELPYWEQAALEKILGGVQFKEEDFEDLLNYCMEDAGLRERAGVKRPTLCFSSQPIGAAKPKSFRLEALSNLRNVNALAPAQRISFGSQLTLIYGNNGAGKTGYTRPLGCAAFALGERLVLPNAAMSPDPAAIPQADVEISTNGAKQVVTWTLGGRCPELAGVHVFDASSLAAHITGANALSFSPAGLSVLTFLAEVTDSVRSRLRQLIAKEDPENHFGPLFSGSSSVSARVGALSARTDLQALKQLTILTSSEETG